MLGIWNHMRAYTNKKSQTVTLQGKKQQLPFWKTRLRLEICYISASVVRNARHMLAGWWRQSCRRQGSLTRTKALKRVVVHHHLFSSIMSTFLCIASPYFLYTYCSHMISERYGNCCFGEIFGAAQASSGAISVIRGAVVLKLILVLKYIPSIQGKS